MNLGMWCRLGVLVVLGLAAAATAQWPSQRETSEKLDYVLGPDDEFKIETLDVPDFSNLVFRVDNGGFTSIPLIGRIRVAGFTSAELEVELCARLKEYVRKPSVVVTIKEFRSQPVSVLGAVDHPGSYQIRGAKRLTEVLALAGGLRNDAGARLRVTRRLSCGRIPLTSAADDPTGRYSIADIPLRLLFGGDPSVDIRICGNDVIAVARADLVYVVGDVQKSGGYVLGEMESLSVLQALSLAGGLMPTSAPQKSRLLRLERGNSSRVEIPVNLKNIFAGRSGDVVLQPEDILFIPSNTKKRVALRAIEALVQTGTGITIWRVGARY